MGSSAQVTFAFLAKDVASGTIRGLSKTISGLGSVAGKVGGILKTGLKVGFAALGGVITGAAAALVKFTKDAIEGAASEAKVVSVLKARGLATKENIAAMEAMVKSGERLAFNGDDIRGSLQTATQFTNNFAKAQKIATVAQDLARSKGISLERATTLVGKAFAGNGQALKNYGIELNKTVTVSKEVQKFAKDGTPILEKQISTVNKTVKGQKALDAILGSVGGTAKTYATTTAGAIQAAGIAIQQAGERAVQPFIPIINELLDIFFTKGLPIIESISQAIAGFIEKNKELISTIIQTAVGFVTKLIPVLVDVAAFIFGTVVPAIVGFIEKLTAPGGVTDSIGKVVGGIMADLVPAFGKFFDGVGKLIGKVFELVGVLWGDGTGPLAIAVQAIGGAFSIVLSILGNIGGVIATAIDFVMKLGKAIMDSPIGFLIKAIAGLVGGAAGAIGGAFGLGGNTGVVPAAVTSGNGRDSVGGQYNVSTSVTFGNDAYSSINTNIGATARNSNGTRTGGRF
jgi:phage-related protein